jgi:hypothetical protein
MGEVDPRDFLFHTGYPMDQVVFMDGTQHITVPPGGYDTRKTIEIPHGLPFTPLPDGYYSETEDFGSSYRVVLSPYDTSSPDLPAKYQVDLSADSTNLTLQVMNFTNTQVTLYFRIYCLAPPNATGDVPHTASDSTDFVINTSFNYCKLAMEGSVYVDAGSSSPPIEHNLGFVPQVMIWRQDDDRIYPFSQIVYYQDDPNLLDISATVSDSSLVFSLKDEWGERGATFYYRIYADD